MIIAKKINVAILGSTGSIGIQLAKKFYKDGENITLFYKNKEKQANLKKIFKSKLNQKIKFAKIDFKNKKSIRNTILANKKIFKSCDILVNTIGELGEIKNFFHLDINKFHKTFNINFFSHIYFFKHLYPLIKKKKNLLIILFSGGGSTSMRENFSAYSLSKVALVKLSEILSKEFINKNIRINIISPGIIKSKMTQKILTSKRNLVDRKEIKKIKKYIKFNNKTINKIYFLIKFLNSNKGKKISGKMISSMWDKPNNWSSSKIDKIVKKDFLTLRRKEI